MKDEEVASSLSRSNVLDADPAHPLPFFMWACQHRKPKAVTDLSTETNVPSRRSDLTVVLRGNAIGDGDDGRPDPFRNCEYHAVQCPRNVSDASPSYLAAVYSLAQETSSNETLKDERVDS